MDDLSRPQRDPQQNDIWPTEETGKRRELTMNCFYPNGKVQPGTKDEHDRQAYGPRLKHPANHRRQTLQK